MSELVCIRKSKSRKTIKVQDKNEVNDFIQRMEENTVVSMRQ